MTTTTHERDLVCKALRDGASPSHAMMTFDVFEEIAGIAKASECIKEWGGKPPMVRFADGVLYPEWEVP